MLLRPTLILMLSMGGAAVAQSGLQPGTGMTVLPGTTLRFEGPQTFSLPSGSTVVNDGTIEFDELSAVIEAPGFPITGTGIERTTRVFALPLAGVDPAGLGLAITTTIAPGSLTLARGHLPITDNGGLQSIARWYDVDAATNSGLDAAVTLHYDPLELNGLSEPALILHIAGDANYWSAFTTAVDEIGNSATATGLDSLGRFTLFDAISTTVNADLEGSSFALFPTLATDVVVVLAATESERRIEVMDLLGRRVIRTAMIGIQGTIDIRSLSAGRYAVMVDGAHAGQFMKP